VITLYGIKAHPNITRTASLLFGTLVPNLREPAEIGVYAFQPNVLFGPSGVLELVISRKYMIRKSFLVDT